jgi:hypothetical protein
LHAGLGLRRRAATLPALISNNAVRCSDRKLGIDAFGRVLNHPLEYFRTYPVTHTETALSGQHQGVSIALGSVGNDRRKGLENKSRCTRRQLEMKESDEIESSLSEQQEAHEDRHRTHAESDRSGAAHLDSQSKVAATLVSTV